MNRFHVCKKFKKFLLVALSVAILVYSVPNFSIHSQALGTTTAYGASQMLLYLSTYFATRGYSLVHENGGAIPSVKDLLDENADRQGQIMMELALRLDNFGDQHNFPELGQKFLAAVTAALMTGSLVISPTVRELIDLYCQTQTASGSLTVGNTYSEISEYFNDPEFAYSITGRGTTYSLSAEVSTIFVCCHSLYDGKRICLLLPSSFDDFEYNALTTFYTIPGLTINPYQSFTQWSYDGKTLYFPYIRIDDAYPSGNADIYRYETTTSNSLGAATEFIQKFYDGELDQTVSGSLVMSQVTDTSTSEVLTSTNTVASDGTVDGNVTYYMLDQSTLIDLLDGYNEGSITYEDLISALGLAFVETDATVSEKEDALATVLIPDSTYDWITKTEWGASLVDETTSDLTATESQEKAKTGVLSQLFARYAGGEEPDPDDQDKAGNAMLIATIAMLLGLWEWPNPDPTNPNGGGTEDDSDGDGVPDSQDPDTQARLQDITQGIVVASTALGSIFSAAGGSAGYGMIFNVGMSFVLFSVIIGASHFLGGLGNHADISSNPKDSPGKGSSKQDKQVVKSGPHRHTRVVKKKGA